jgi:hypothetical protein
MIRPEEPVSQRSRFESHLIIQIVIRNASSYILYLIDGFVGEIIKNPILFALKRYLKNGRLGVDGLDTASNILKMKDLECKSKRYKKRNNS